MAIALAILLLLLGTVAMVAATVMMSARKAVKSFMDGFPRQLHALMAESDPKVKKSLQMLERLPTISQITGGVGVAFFLMGIFLIPSPVARIVLLVLGTVVALLVFKFKDRLVPLIKKQLMDQMKQQAAKQPPMTPQQVRKSMQDARNAARPNATPVNRQQRREAQRKKQ